MISSFVDLSLDIRLEKALLKAGFCNPTCIQAHALPVLFTQKLDVFIHAETGSGKTLVYILPTLAESLKNFNTIKGVSSIILLPTRDLAEQVSSVYSTLMRYTPNEVQLVNLCADLSTLFIKSVLARNCPSILIATPSLLLKYIKEAIIELDGNCLKYMIVDEADFTLGIGFESILAELLTFIPTTVRRILLSATLSDEVERLKKRLLSQAVTIKLEDPSDSEHPQRKGVISHYYYKSNHDKADEKFILVLVLLKFKLIPGRILIFTNSVMTCYKLKLFLESFYIKSCVINGELPLSSRYNIIEEANKGKFDCIIAADQIDLKPSKQPEEGFGISRGIDFKGLALVINFDIPTTVKSYCHRAGRTGRNSDHGAVLTLLNNRDSAEFRQIGTFLQDNQAELKPFSFDMNQVEGLKYRAVDVLKSVTPNRIKAAKMRDLKNHILMSEKLLSHFKSNANDLRTLRQDQDLQLKKNKSHLKHIPDYLLTPFSAFSVKAASLPKLNGEFGTSAMATKLAKKSFQPRFKKQKKADPLYKIK